MNLPDVENFFAGLIGGGVSKLEGAVMFGPEIWNGLTPEQQATVKAAIAKAVVAAAEAYVGKSSSVA